VAFLVPNVHGQTGGASVTLRATVSEIVALSIPPNFTDKAIDASVLGSGSSVRITLLSSDADSPVIRVPLLVRSNSGFRISAMFESQTAELTELSITDARATGALVSPNVINALAATPLIDPNASRPMSVVSGPRVSLGGTLNSPNNALQITLLIRLKPQPVPGWSAHLTLVATPE
jgi:hypothetical protein